MLWGFFIQKATQKHIRNILKKEKCIYTESDVAQLMQGNQKGTRYGNKVLLRDEDGTQRKRFIKIVLDGTLKTYKLFKRQVKITAALHTDANYTFPTLAVIDYSLLPPVPYAIFETREDGAAFGFMHDSPVYYERFTETEMQKMSEVIYAFHNAGFTVERKTLKFARPITSELDFYKKECGRSLDTVITHKTKAGQQITAPVEELLVRYTGVKDVRDRIIRILEKNFIEVEASKIAKGNFLVHADMQIDNVYSHPNGNFELLDFEWVGKSDNPVIPIMFDHGNLRARAWSSPKFQKLLDAAMIEVGKKYYPEEVVRAGIVLGTLRSSVDMSRYHLDVVNTVKKDKRTEEDYFEMFPRTLAALTEVLGEA